MCPPPYLGTRLGVSRAEGAMVTTATTTTMEAATTVSSTIPVAMQMIRVVMKAVWLVLVNIGMMAARVVVALRRKIPVMTGLSKVAG